MKRFFPDFLLFAIMFILVFSPYVILSFRLAPLNEEEWIVGKKIFLVGFDTSQKKEVLSFDFCSYYYDDKSQFYNARVEILPNIYLVFSKLPPLVSLCFFRTYIPILGWGHVGPISLIYYKIFEWIFQPADIFSTRIPSLVLIIVLAFVFAYKLKSVYASIFFLSFPVSLFFIPSADIYYSLLYIFSVLSFFSLVEGRMRSFCVWSCLAVLTHLRGFVVFLSFFVVLIVFSLAGNRIHYFQEVKFDKSYFLKTLPFLALVIFCLCIYFLPSLGHFPESPSLYTVEAFSSLGMFKFFIFEILRKIFSLFQVLGTRIGDVLISSNIFLVIRELGLLKAINIFILVFSVLVSVLFFAPAFLSKKYLYYLIFFSSYFVLSFFAVPFFVSMPWQFIPVNFLILIPSYFFFNEKKIKIIPVAFGALLCWYSVYDLDSLVSDYALWSKHVQVKEKILSYKEAKVLSITKSNVFHLFQHTVEAKYFVQLSEERGNRFYRFYLSDILRQYDVIVLSYHFFHLEDIVLVSHSKVYEDNVFRVFVK